MTGRLLVPALLLLAALAPATAQQVAPRPAATAAQPPAPQPPAPQPPGQIEVTSRDGIEWRQNEQMVIARGDARAVRNDVTVLGDVLIARYRKKAGTAGAQQVSAKPNGTVIPGTDSGSNEIYRIEAEGHVKIFNNSDIAVGDHAVWDLDQSVVVMTGADMSLTTPNQVMTARDTLEYYSQKHMAVGRGLATVVTSDGRRLSADTLVAYLKPPEQQPGARPAATPAKPGAATDPLGAGGKLERVEAFGHVEARTADQVITGERGVYVADTQIARIAGDVQVTRGQNHGVGDEALVNMKTGVSTLIRHPGHRVEGLIVPNSTGSPGQPPAKPGKK